MDPEFLTTMAHDAIADALTQSNDKVTALEYTAQIIRAYESVNAAARRAERTIHRVNDAIAETRRNNYA